MSVPRDYRKTGNGFVYQKNWPYTNLMNFQMIKVKLNNKTNIFILHTMFILFFKLFEEGIINQKIVDWMGKKDASNCDLENDVR